MPRLLTGWTSEWPARKAQKTALPRTGEIGSRAEPGSLLPDSTATEIFDRLQDSLSTDLPGPALGSTKCSFPKSQSRFRRCNSACIRGCLTGSRFSGANDFLSIRNVTAARNPQNYGACACLSIDSQLKKSNFRALDLSTHEARQNQAVGRTPCAEVNAAVNRVTPATDVSTTHLFVWRTDHENGVPVFGVC